MPLQTQQAQQTSELLVSIDEIAAFANNVNLDREIIAFESAHPVKEGMDVPIRIDAMAIILCQEGEGKVEIDLQEYEIKRNTMLVIQPQNYICHYRSSQDFKSKVLVCSLRVVEEVLPKLTDLLPLIIKNRINPVSYLTDEEAMGIDSFYQFLKMKLEGPHTPFLKHKVMCVLQAALFEMMDIRCQHDNLEGRQNTRKEEIMAKFILSVCEHFREERQVSYYADLLCITPKHLSAVVKETSGKTAGEWIENYVILEAKMLLTSTDLTIQQIATKLNFTNQSFFGKYFKHITGYSPTQFRSNPHTFSRE